MTQYARPNKDKHVGSWTPTPLYQQINEATASDGDYIQSPNQTGVSYCDLGLSRVRHPGPNATHTVRWRFWTQALDARLTVLLRNVLGTVASWSLLSSVGAWTTKTETLTAAQAKLITDYSQLDIRFLAQVSGITPLVVRVSWTVVEVPKAAERGDPLEVYKAGPRKAQIYVPGPVAADIQPI